MKFIGRHWRLILAGFLGWTLFGVIFALQSYVNAVYVGQPVYFFGALVSWLICGYAWGVLTPLVIFAAGRFPLETGNLKRNLPVHLFFGAVAAFLHLSIYILIQQTFFVNPQIKISFWEAFQRLSVVEFHVDLLTYWILVGIWHLREINRRYVERERETARLALAAAQLETRLAEARLDALRMQLHPHFLFNTLNSISVLMRAGDAPTANKMLVRLSELLRAALKSESAQEVSLREELEFLCGYLEIEQLRFEDRLTVDFEIDNETLEARIPNLILQPLVENAIRHGIAPQAEKGTISIESRRENGFIEISVSDNGAGFQNTAETQGGIGLKNTRERLEKLYGERQTFEILECAGGGLKVCLKIPFHQQ